MRLSNLSRIIFNLKIGMNFSNFCISVDCRCHCCHKLAHRLLVLMLL